jgi:hypothetical protein
MITFQSPDTPYLFTTFELCHVHVFVLHPDPIGHKLDGFVRHGTDIGNRIVRVRWY